MARPVIERRLTEVGERLSRLRSDLAVAEEQLAHLMADADDARVRSLVSETALSERAHRGAERHARAMERHREDLPAGRRGPHRLLPHPAGLQRGGGDSALLEEIQDLRAQLGVEGNCTRY